MKRRGRRPNLETPEALEDVLERAGEDRFARKKLPIPLRDWRLAVGPRIADRARPMSLDRGVLTVRVATSVWANELSLLAPELIARLVARGFAVKELRFRVGPLDLPPDPTQKRTYRKVPPPAKLAPEIQASLAKVADDELRATLERAAAANLAWQDYVSAEQRGARAPRGAGKGSARPDRSARDSGGASGDNSGGGSGRRR